MRFMFACLFLLGLSATSFAQLTANETGFSVVEPGRMVALGWNRKADWNPQVWDKALKWSGERTLTLALEYDTKDTKLVIGNIWLQTADKELWKKGGTAMHEVSKKYKEQPLTADNLKALAKEMRAAVHKEFEK